jgi:hypothetical protein
MLSQQEGTEIMSGRFEWFMMLLCALMSFCQAQAEENKTPALPPIPSSSRQSKVSSCPQQQEKCEVALDFQKRSPASQKDSLKGNPQPPILPAPPPSELSVERDNSGSS